MNVLILSALAMQANDYCLDSSAAPATATYFVDSNLDNELALAMLGDDEGPSDLSVTLDQSLQGIQRMTRSRTSVRLIENTACEGTAKLCISAAKDAEDSTCLWNPGWAAYENGDHDIIFCLDHPLVDGTSRGVGLLHTVLQHEFGHAFGLAHVEDCDVCDGETMCQSPGSASSAPRFGDKRGMRDFRSGLLPEDRAVHFRQRSPGSSGGTTANLGISASYGPRIDCSRSPGTDKCIVAHSDVVGGSQGLVVQRLNNWVSPSFSSISQTTLSLMDDVDLPPDIAISGSGMQYFIVVGRPNDSQTEVIAQNVGPYPPVRANLGFDSVLPPRIAHYADAGGALIIGFKASASNPFRGDWIAKFVKLHAVTNVLTVSSVSLEALNFEVESNLRFPSAEYDFDCRSQTGPDQCVLVAALHDNEIHSGVIRSRSFVYDPVASSLTLATDWTNGAFYSLQAVSGVAARSTGGFAVTLGRATSLGTAANTRTIEYLNNSVSATNFLYTFTEKGDINACNHPTGNADNPTQPDASSWGGYSVAWCDGCSGGRYVGLQLGQADTAPVNACF
jgi:hypothetical protein